MAAVAAGVAHEVRNPLNSLRINLRILEDELREQVPAGSQAFAVLGRIAAEIRRLDDFVTDFLRFARPPRLNRERQPVRTLLLDLVAFLSAECAKRGVELGAALEDGPTEAVVDGFQVKQAVLNLLLNALQATRAGGHILVRTGGDPSRLLITVEDDGEGIEDAIREKVFTVFFTTREDGTGLGLPIVRRIVEEHGGSVAIESAGQGTRVTLVLPTGLAG